MLTADRHRLVLNHVRDHGSATITELSEWLGVSEATIRRDLDGLAADGLLRRVRGGACDARGVRPESDRNSFADVAVQNPEAKTAIARRAADLVDDGDVIALDIGTTVAAMCPFLAERSITVATASMAVVRALEFAPGIDIIVLGGLLRPNYSSLVGTLTEQAIRQLRFDKAFLGTSGLRPDGAVMDSTPSEVPVKRCLLDSATQAHLLADSEKFPGGGFWEVCRLDRFDSLVTNVTPPDGALPSEIELEVLVP